MHLRFSTCRGALILEEGTEEPIGRIAGILIHPDVGVIEGFFVRPPGLFAAGELFLAAADIAHWGAVVRVRSGDVLAPLEERVRLQALTEERRPVLGQRIVTESGMPLGQCGDVQFETQTFRLEWMFPRKMFRWQRPLPASAIAEVRSDAIIVRDLSVEEPQKPAVLRAIDELTEAPVPPRLPDAS